MKCIELMKEEHQNILRMLAVIRKKCYAILKGEPINVEDFYKIIDFVKNYADRHHHGKEENMLFNRMILELGETAEKLVKHGMLVEHDTGRLYIQDLEEALKRVEAGEDEARVDVVANAIAYTQLMKRHIEKEDKVVYTYAEKNMQNATLDAINSECEAYERSETARQAKEKYIPLLEELESQ